jgi:dipeptidyl aminopeptidase/acylaminoacyl peptidase
VLESSFSHKDPDYSSVRQQIAYTANKNGHYELWLADADGNNRKPLTHLELNVRHPKWSHDGNYIAFLAAKKDQIGDSLYIYDIEKERIKTVETGYKNHNRPTWSADDKALISAIRVNGKFNLYSIDTHSFLLRQLTDKNGRLGYISEQGDLLFSTNKDGLWRQPLHNKGHAPEQVLPAEFISSPYAWIPSSNGIYFQHHSNSTASIRYLDFTTKQITHILSLPSGHISWSANLVHIDNLNTLLLPLKRLPQSDIKRLLHPQLTLGKTR